MGNSLAFTIKYVRVKEAFTALSKSKGLRSTAKRKEAIQRAARGRDPMLKTKAREAVDLRRSLDTREGR